MKRKLSDATGGGASATFTCHRKTVEGRDMLVFRNQGAGVAFMVSPDDLYDAAGNRFENDLPLATELTDTEKRRRLVEAAERVRDETIGLRDIHTLEDISSLPEKSAARLYDLIVAFETPTEAAASLENPIA